MNLSLRATTRSGLHGNSNLNFTHMYRAEWVNSVVKQRLHKAFALHHEDVRTREQFKALLQIELDEIAEDLTNSRLFFANLAELRKVLDC